MTLRWTYESEQYVARNDLRAVGYVFRMGHSTWEASAMGNAAPLSFRRLTDAQRWVEKRAEDTCSA